MKEGEYMTYMNNMLQDSKIYDRRWHNIQIARDICKDKRRPIPSHYNTETEHIADHREKLETFADQLEEQFSPNDIPQEQELRVNRAIQQLLKTRNPPLNMIHCLLVALTVM